MAVRFDTSADALTRNTGLWDYNAAYTWMAWVYVVSKSGAGYQNLMIRHGGGSQGDQLYINNAGNWALYCANGGSSDVAGSSPSTGTWYHVAVVRSSTTALALYIDGASSADVTNTLNVAARTDGTPKYELGVNAYSEWCDMRMEHVKLFTAALTVAEIQQEMRTAHPHRAAWGWWTLRPNERTTDWSGNGRDLTAAGTLTDESGPPVSWGVRPWVVPFVVAAGGGDQSITVADSGAGADSLAQLAVALAMADTGAGSDAFGGAASLAATDAGAGVDALAQLLASLGLTETGSGADALANVQVAATVADSGTGTDSQAISVVLTVADSGAGVDAALAIILIAIADAGSAADNLASITATLAVLDAAGGADALTVAVTVSVADAGSAAEAIALLTEAVKSISDSGTGVDLVLAPAVSLVVMDASSAFDAAVVSVTLAVSDAASGADSLSVITAVLISILEAGAGVEALAVNVAPLAVADGGTSVDAAGVAVTLGLSDAAAGNDAVLAAVLIAVADAAVAVDAVGSITVNVPVADLGQAVDAIGAISAVLAVLDLGAGVDAAVRFDSAVRIVQVVFTLTGRSTLFAWAARVVSFGWAARTMAFALNT